MLKATLYFVTKITLPLQISENSEADLESMPRLGCNSCACVDIAGILHLPQKVTIATSILVQKPHKWNFATKTNFARN